MHVAFSQIIWKFLSKMRYEMTGLMDYFVGLFIFTYIVRFSADLTLQLIIHFL